jgi:hypothetical protein
MVELARLRSGEFERTDAAEGGLTYKVTLDMSSRTSTFATQNPISADGELNFSWRPAPEPSSILFLAFASVAVLCRRRPSMLSSVIHDYDAPSPPSL